MIAPRFVLSHLVAQQRFVHVLRALELDLVGHEIQVDAAIEVDEHDAFGARRIEVVERVGQRVDEHVVGLDVGVQDARVVQVLENAEHLESHVENEPVGKRLVVCHVIVHQGLFSSNERTRFNLQILFGREKSRKY